MAGLRYAVATHEGHVRANNEDNFWVDGLYRRQVEENRLQNSGKAKPSRFLAAVCDGMGGESSGEIASLLAVQCLQPHRFAQLPDAALADIQRANRSVCSYISRHGGVSSGSTMAALYIDSGRAVCCNVGDSRVYYFHDGKLSRLSKDHNRAQRMVDSGMMTEEQARASSEKHRLTQYLGIFEEEMLLEPWISQPIRLSHGDRFLICSDGLTDMMWDAEIAEILASRDGPGQQAQALLQGALDSGGKDNVTVIVVQIGTLPRFSFRRRKMG